MKRFAVGIDIGGTNTAFGAVDQQGRILAEATLPTVQYPHVEDYPRYADDLTAALQRLIAGLDGRLTGIGIGAPNADCHHGTLDRPANLFRFRDDDPDRRDERRIFPLAATLSERFGGVPVRITNDANAAAIGEMVYGNARGMRDFIVITLGTGLGSGIVANGELLCGHDGFAGELGHIIAERGGRRCGCGRQGCLECYVSATGIRRTALELLDETDIPSRLRDVPAETIDGALLSAAADAGDPLAGECFRRTGERLGRALADIVAITSPEAVFLFGGLAKAGEKLFEPARRTLEAEVMYPFRGKTKLLASGLIDRNAAVLGGAALIWQTER